MAKKIKKQVVTTKTPAKKVEVKVVPTGRTGRPKEDDSLRAKVEIAMKKLGSKKRGRWAMLSEIYSEVGVKKNDVGQTAAIRGLVNKRAKNAQFEKGEARATYRLTANVSRYLKVPKTEAA